MKPQEIKRLRTELGWSQADMARHFGYTAASVMKWERGMSEPSDMVTAALIQIRRQLDERKKKQKQEFINGLTATFVTGGLVALLAYAFKN